MLLILLETISDVSTSVPHFEVRGIRRGNAIFLRARNLIVRLAVPYTRKSSRKRTAKSF